MRVEFTGSPADVIRNMRELLELIDPQPPRSAAYDLQLPKRATEPTLDLMTMIAAIPRSTIQALTDDERVTAACRLLPTWAAVSDTRGPKVEETPPPPKPQPQTSDEHACQFCGKYTHVSARRLATHENHCRSNPSRVPHPKEGKPLPPGFGPRKKRAADRASSLDPADDPSDSSPASRSNSDASAPASVSSALDSPAPVGHHPDEPTGSTTAPRGTTGPTTSDARPSKLSETSDDDDEDIDEVGTARDGWLDDDEDADL